MSEGVLFSGRVAFIAAVIALALTGLARMGWSRTLCAPG